MKKWFWGGFDTLCFFRSFSEFLKEGGFDSSLYLLIHGQVCQQTPLVQTWDDSKQEHVTTGGEEISVGNRRVFGMIGFFTDAQQLETIISKVRGRNFNWHKITGRLSNPSILT